MLNLDSPPVIQLCDCFHTNSTQHWLSQKLYTLSSTPIHCKITSYLTTEWLLRLQPSWWRRQ